MARPPRAAPFTVEKLATVDLPLWQQPVVLDLARSFAWPVGTLLFGALVLLGFVRPALKAVSQPVAVAEAAGLADGTAGVGTGGQIDALEAEQPERAQLPAPDKMHVATPGELALEDARKLTRDNPAAVANIVKAWMSGEAPA